MPSLSAPGAYALKGNTISTTALAISHASWSWGSTDLAEADRAVVACNTEGVALTYDGTTPTASLGIPLAAGANLEVKGNANIRALKLIRSGGSDAAVTVQLEKYS
jgi:hypothetical protein